MDYWKRIEHYSKFHDPNILTGQHYEQSFKKVMKERRRSSRNKNKKKVTKTKK